MKILYLITKSEVGGAQTHVYQLCNYFRSGHDVTVMAQPGGWLEKKCSELNVRFVPNIFFSNSLNPLNVIRSYFEVRKVIREVKPDILHCHSSVAGFLGRISVRNEVPTVYTAHGWGFNTGVSFFQKWLSISAEKIVSRYAKKIIAVSQFVKDLGVEYRIAPQEKFEVIYNGVDIEKKEIKKDGMCSIIFIGRLAAPKQPLLLLQAIRDLNKTSKESIRVDVVGDGPQKESLQEFIINNDLSELVTLHGALNREDVSDVLTKSDIFVLLSEWEGFPISILEAMGAGLPVIVSHVGGVSEAVKDGVNGFILKEKTVDEITRYLNLLINDKKLRKEMGVRAQQSVANFSVHTMLLKTENVYRKVSGKVV